MPKRQDTQGTGSVPLLTSQTVLDDPNVPIAVRVIDQTDLNVHRHDFMELVVVLDGSGEHVLDDDRFPIFAGDVFVIDENHRHGYRNAHEMRIANILFDEKALLARDESLALLAGYQALFHLEPVARRKLSFAGKLHLPSESRLFTEQRVFALQAELTAKREGYRAVAVSLLVETIVHLCRVYTAGDSAAQKNLLDIGRVVGYLETHYAESIELDGLTELVAMSGRTLMRRFGEATGTTPMQYLLRLRIDRAATLLRTTSMSITEIADAVGFHDSNYFTRQFRRVMETSPRRWRRSAVSGP